MLLAVVVPLWVVTSALLAGYLIVPFIRPEPYLSRPALALLAGLALLIVVLSWLGAWLGSDLYAYPLLAMVVGAPLLIRPTRRALLSDLKMLSGNAWFWTHLTVAVLLVGFLNNPNLLPGSPVLFEGRGNHDVLHWVVCADALRDQGYLYPVIQREAGGFIFAQFAGWWTWDGRLGSELLLAWISTLVGAEPAFIYNAFAASMLVFWGAGVSQLASAFGSRRLPHWVPAVTLPLQPAFVFYYTNGNLPNLLGAILGAGAVTLFVALLRDQIAPLWRRCAVAAMMLSGILTTYPELLPFLVLSLCLIPWLDGERIPLSRSILFAGGAFILAALWNPISTVRGVGTVWIKATADIAGGPGSVLRDLEAYQWIPSLLTIDPGFGHSLSGTTGLLCTGLLVIMVGLARKFHQKSIAAKVRLLIISR